jgi:hypothetical protein
MIPVLFASMLDVHPWTLVRVEDPNAAGAEVWSGTGAVLLEAPPPGVAWRWASVPVTDDWPATEALDVMNADLWHADGARGQGVKVAVFDVAWFGAQTYDNDLGQVYTHDCFRDPTCGEAIDTEGRFSFERGVHGYACAEVVRDVAPEAELHLVRVNTFTAFENAADWAIREGIDVISMSMSFFNDSIYDGTAGPFSKVLARLEAHDVLLVTSAGNYADSHWRGPYRDLDLDGRADFNGDNGLYLWLGSGEKQIYVNWNQHMACGTTDLDAYVFNAAHDIVGRGEDAQSRDADRCQPVERVKAVSEEAGWHWVEVQFVQGSQVGVVLDVHSRAGYFDEPVADGSITDPATHPLAFAVGAVRASNYLTGPVESFSSYGLAGSGKPDIAGPDGLTTRAYGADGFFGTSASTPAVAGLIAVVMSDDVQLTPRRAAEKTQAWAFGQEFAGIERERDVGPGRARLPDPELAPGSCGRRRLWAGMLVLPMSLFRRRRR